MDTNLSNLTSSVICSLMTANSSYFCTILEVPLKSVAVLRCSSNASAKDATKEGHKRCWGCWSPYFHLCLATLVWRAHKIWHNQWDGLECVGSWLLCCVCALLACSFRLPFEGSVHCPKRWKLYTTSLHNLQTLVLFHLLIWIKCRMLVTLVVVHSMSAIPLTPGWNKMHG